MLEKWTKKIQDDFVEMLQRHGAALYGVRFQYTDRSREEIQDLYQEIVYNLWQSYGTFRGDSSEFTWLYRIALRTARRYKKKSLLRESLFTSLTPELYNIADEAAADERIVRLYELVEQLAPDDHKLAMLFLNNKSVKEMAKALKCSERTVERRISNLKKLLEQMNKKE